jgi:phospholipase/lecithinase/hemolysin
VPNLIPLDRSPEAPDDRREFMQQWIEGFNTGLAIHLAAFRCDHPDACVFAPDFYQAMTDILDQPQAHGFGNVCDRCYDAAADVASSDPISFVWWDGCHPSARSQRYLAKSALGCFSQALPLLHEGVYPTDTLTYLSQFGNLSDSLS